MIRSLLLAGSAMLVLPAMALPVPASAQTEPADGYHDPRPSDIVVTAIIPRRQGDILSGTSVVTGDELTRSLRTTIGETLARQPGVSATSFGPNASRPVLRGFQGERVRILTDGIGSFDVSNTSVDHAVAINPLTAERIEVLRGPSALLYGSSAIGGVVNVIDSRIPRRVPDEAIHIDAIGTYGTAANERSGALELEAPLGNNFVAHFDGTYNKTGNLDTGGYILAPAQRAQAAASGDADIADLANLRGTLPNSAGRNWEVAGGLAYIDEGGSLGFSVSHLDNLYGVPVRYALEPGEEAEEVRLHIKQTRGDLRGKLPNSAGRNWEVAGGLAYIDDGGSLGFSVSRLDNLYGVPVRYALEPGEEAEEVRLHIKQTRADMRAEIAANGAFLDSIRLRAGFANYQHQELEDTGEVGTTFYNQSIESRLEFVQSKRGGWDGAFGGQMFVRDFSVVGEEKFLPKNETQQFGLFTLQSLDLGSLRIEGGARYERSILKAVADEDLGNDATRRTFNALSGSLGASYELTPGWRLGLNLARTERAPSAEELFARGNHAGTQAFELGNPAFLKEKSWGLEGTLRGGGPGYSVAVSAYHNWFDNFIYESVANDAVCQAVNGGADLEFPCFQFNQAKARYYGFEIEGKAKLAQVGSYAINADASADYVRASITGTGPAPRIPPMRLLGGLEAASDRVTARAEIEHSFKQDRVTDFETETGAFTLVNASVAFKPIAGNNQTTLLFSANNIFDVVARRHASFLKDFAPLAGRDFRVTARVGF